MKPTTGSPLVPGTSAAGIVEEEERLLADVAVRLATTVAAEDGAPSHDYDRELVELRDAIGEAKPEDLAPLVEQMARLQAIAGRRGRSRGLPVDPMTPYFAHIRLREGSRERDVLIGKRGFVAGGGAVPIVDWRNAPVSRIYYRYEEGDDYDETENGHHLEGVVSVRRNLSIYNGRLRRIGAPQGTFVRDARGTWHATDATARPVLQGGQGKAARPPRPEPPRERGRLGVHHGPVPRADKHLPEIAALIDREQFDLITSPTSGLVLIQGGAGSGKTTVALHRVAFLNFSDPNRFKPKKMLVVVPSRALERYVAGVLPALGVTGVPVQTWRSWAEAMRKKLLPGLKARLAEDTPEAVARVKKHPALLHALERVVADADAACALEIEAECDPQVTARFRATANRPLVPRLGKLLTWLAKQDTLPVAARHRADAVIRRLRRRAADVVRDWEETLTDRSLLHAAFAGTDVGEAELRVTLEWAARWKDIPSWESFEGVDADRLVGIDGRSEVSGQIVERPLGEDPDGEAEPLDLEAAGRLDAEDDALLLRLVQLKRGGLVDPRTREEIRYEHIAIDEAQDFAAADLKVLLHATTPQRSVTVAGDSAQRLVFDNGFSDWRSHLAEAGHDAVEIRPLRLSYRSTAEVMSFSRQILGPLASPDEPLVARNGAPVEVHRYLDVGEAAAFLGDALRSLVAREPTASMALICRHPEQADLIFAALQRSEVPALRRVRREDFPFTPGIDVTDVAQVKGLEFDYVVLVDVNATSYPDSLEARHLLHIGATRAAHQLWLIVTGDPSPLLPPELVPDL